MRRLQRWALASMALAGLVRAQPAAVLPYSEWKLSYAYTTEARVDSPGQVVNYQGGSNGEVVLRWDQDPDTQKTFVGFVNAPIVVRYEGAAFDPSNGCGMRETVISTGQTNCEHATQLGLGETEWSLNLGCYETPVSHTFSWLGSCGPLFPYPEDPVTSWRWQLEDRFIGAASIGPFPYPQSGSVLEGTVTGTAAALLSPLWTSLASGQLADGTWRVSYVLTPKDPEDLVLEIDDTGAYRDWRPQAEAPDGHGAALDLEVRLFSTSGKTPSSRIRKITWQLEGTSKEPGISMNFPLAASDTGFDLRLHPAGGKAVILEDEEQRIIRFDPDGFTDRIQVIPWDWGGWADLKVTAELADGRFFVARVKSTSATRLPLPRRRDGSYIAEVWRTTPGADSADAEDETGDGLTLYEEYRGFYEDGKHISGDPKRRDFFVRNDADGAAWNGIKYFELLSHFAVHPKMAGEELGASRVINANHARGPRRGNQHGVVVMVIVAREGSAEAIGGPGPPKKVDHIELMGAWRNLTALTTGKVVTHELFHAANVYHHGEANEERTWWLDRAAGRIVEGVDGVRLFLETGADVTANFIRNHQPGALKLDVGTERGPHSGAEQCIMRYFSAQAYDSKTNPANQRISVDEPIGLILCSSGAGTGVNENGRMPVSRYGPAAPGRGDCGAQLFINDSLTAPVR